MEERFSWGSRACPATGPAMKERREPMMVNIIIIPNQRSLRLGNVS
jgi:hypothetical protein